MKKQKRRGVQGKLGPSSASKPKKTKKLDHSQADEDDGQSWKEVVECGPAIIKRQIRQTQKLIKRLKTSQLCLYPGKIPSQQDGIARFTGCLQFLGDCDCLVFCETQNDKDFVRELVPNQFGWSDGGESIQITEVKPQRIDEDDLVHDESLFPEIGVQWTPFETGPRQDRFWGHYSLLELKIRGKRKLKQLHLLHLGIGGQAVWLHFLQPNGINVARIITNPPYE